MSHAVRLTPAPAALVLAIVLGGCGSSGDSGPAIEVSVDPTTATVQVGSIQSLTARVQNDSSGQGVTWAVSPGTGVGTLSDATATSVTYNAPTDPPDGEQAVTITATSREDSSKSASATITVPGALVQVTPSDALVDANTTLTLTATVQNDTSDAGVTWAISPETGAGELSDVTATSVIYRAPADPPTSDLTVEITATSVAQHAAVATSTITLPAIVVAIEPTAATVEARSSQPLTATVDHDPSHAGVTWTISPESGAGSLIDVTDTSATYEAPASAPPESLDVVITATSVAAETAAATANMTVPSIAVELAPDSALIPANGTQAFVATVTGDPDNLGASWTLSQDANPCSPNCGSLASTDSTTATFVAPSTMPVNTAVTLTATSLTDSTKSAASAIELSSGTVQLAPAALDFGVVKVSRESTRSLTLTNVDDAALAISGIGVEGQGAGAFSVHTDCGASVAPGASCQIDVTFAPGSTANAIANLSIQDSSSDSPQLVPLSGRGGEIRGPIPAVQRALGAGKTLATPAPTGPDHVGTRTVALIDQARRDPYRDDRTQRELSVRFWYPTPISGGCKPARYAEPAVWDYLADLLGRSLPAVRTHSCSDAPIPSGAHPVVVFTHGYTGTFTDYTYLFEDLASRGYVVASIGHTYESTAVALPDGRLAKSMVGSHLTHARVDAKTLSRVESVRLSDVRFVVDELARLNGRLGSPFAGRLDLASVGIAGHSLGGLTALQAAEQDARLRAVVVIDGVMPDAAFGSTDTPVLLLNAGRERWSPREATLWRKLGGLRVALNLDDAEHVAPSDLVWLAKPAIDTGRLTAEQTVAQIRDSVAAFFDASLRGRPLDPLLTRARTRSPEATGSVL